MSVAERQKPAPGELFLDHVSHFVPDVDAAASVFESLGMKVTAASAQTSAAGPVGATNRCVMLAEGYIELLMPTHDSPSAQRMRALMARSRGTHLVCFGTPDAEGEQRRLTDHGFDSQLVEFERAVPGGSARFKAVRVAPEAMPEGRIQYVEQLTPEQVWREGEINDFRLTEVTVTGRDPVEIAARWARFMGAIPHPSRDGIFLDTARGRIVVQKSEAPAIAGYALACGHPEAFAARCSRAGLAVEGRLVRLPPAVGGVLRIG